MKDTKHDLKHDALVGAAGVVVGAGAAVAAQILSDKKLRAKVVKAAGEIRGKAEESLHSVRDKAETLRESVTDEMKEGKSAVKKATSR